MYDVLHRIPNLQYAVSDVREEEQKYDLAYRYISATPSRDKNIAFVQFVVLVVSVITPSDIKFNKIILIAASLYTFFQSLIRL